MRSASSTGTDVTFTVDRRASARKKNKLERYFADHVWNSTDGFVCLSKNMCRASAMQKPGTAYYEGQGQMVGPCFDLFVDDAPFRVLVVPIEYGTTRRGVTVAERTAHVVGETAKKPFRQLNPHMRGVTLTLQLAFGLPVGESGPTHLSLPNRPAVHLFEAYSMVNMLWCTAVKKGTMSSRSTGMMRASCTRHMRATIDILKPTLIVSQGVVLDETLRASLGVREPVNAHVAHCELDGNQFVWASLRHPTLNWHSVKYPYFSKVVVPTIRTARELALSTSAPTSR